MKTELEFNKGAEFQNAHDPDPKFLRTEASAPMGTVFDVEPDEIAGIWEKLDTIAMDV